MSDLSARYEAIYNSNKIYFCVFDRKYVLVETSYPKKLFKKKNESECFTA